MARKICRTFCVYKLSDTIWASFESGSSQPNSEVFNPQTVGILNVDLLLSEFCIRIFTRIFLILREIL